MSEAKSSSGRKGADESAKQKTAQKVEHKDGGKPARASAREHNQQGGPDGAGELQRETRGRPGGGFTAALALVIALSAAGFTAWQVYESRRTAAELDLELARRLSEIETIGSDSRRLSSAARDIARDVEARLGQLEARLVGVQNQRMAMESLYQELSRSQDEWTLAEVEQILLFAGQQLQLANNVKAALVALEAADSRLARSDRPQLTPVRRAIAADIDQLKASPFVDVTGIGLKLESMAVAADTLPLAMVTRPGVSHKAAEAPNEGWSALLSELWQDVRDLIRVERVDAPTPPLLAPEQAFFLRENLKLRLLSARLALLARDEATYKADLTAAREWLNRYFEAGAQPVEAALGVLDELMQSGIEVELPDVGASLDAVRSYRLVQERSLR